ncbi:hypothetical protein [Paenibacillus endoradicis]|uniref:hypothetical protein n=1 Tax=Paenibacillus endoradicis TaxID=2972487 RepID=UPI00215908ED|nr:hypothetical protein [Paenibacillus endoradicis]MCR8656795.1 hypothetical protein [Paenibacillus endoradicis]
MSEMIVSSSNRVAKNVFRTIVQALTELIFLAPLYVTIGIYLFSPVAMLGWFIGLVIAYTLPQLMLKEGKQYKNYTRVGFIIINSVILLAFLYSSFPSQLRVFSIIVWFIATVFFIHSGIRNFMYSWRGSFTPTIMTLGIIAYIVLQILKVTLLTEIAHHNGLFYGLGMGALILFLYITNERTLGEHQIVDETSRTFRMSLRINRVIITIISVVLLLIALLRGIQQQIEDWIMNLIRQFFAWLSSFESSEVAEKVTPPPPMEGMGEAIPTDDPSTWWIILEKIFKYIAITLLVLAAVFIIVYGTMMIVKGVKKLIARLFNPYKLASDLHDGYIDEVEDLQPVAKRAKQLKRVKLKYSPMNTQSWSKLSNEDKARGLYKHVVKEQIDSGFHYQSSHTAKETIEEVQVRPQSERKSTKIIHRNEHNKADYDQLIDMYNDVRYGDKTANESSLQKLFEKFVKKN